MAELDQYTKQMAEEFANNEAEAAGFERGSAKWKTAYNSYCSEATKTMTPGRMNPYTIMNPSSTVLKQYFPELFGDQGAAGFIASHYKGEAMTTKAVDQRIMASITNLVKLFENGKMGAKTQARGKYGKIENGDMTDFQLPKRPEGMSDAEYSKLTRPVLRRWVLRDLLTVLMVESLLPFFTMSKDDIEWILDSMNLKDGTIKQYQAGGEASIRHQMITALHKVISRTVLRVNYRRILWSGLRKNGGGNSAPAAEEA